jgi:hypothetical protein
VIGARHGHVLGVGGQRARHDTSTCIVFFWRIKKSKWYETFFFWMEREIKHCSLSDAIQDLLCDYCSSGLFWIRRCALFQTLGRIKIYFVADLSPDLVPVLGSDISRNL